MPFILAVWSFGLSPLSARSETVFLHVADYATAEKFCQEASKAIQETHFHTECVSTGKKRFGSRGGGGTKNLVQLALGSTIFFVKPIGLFAGLWATQKSLPLHGDVIGTLIAVDAIAGLMGHETQKLEIWPQDESASEPLLVIDEFDSEIEACWTSTFLLQYIMGRELDRILRTSGDFDRFQTQLDAYRKDLPKNDTREIVHTDRLPMQTCLLLSELPFRDRDLKHLVEFSTQYNYQSLGSALSRSFMAVNSRKSVKFDQAVLDDAFDQLAHFPSNADPRGEHFDARLWSLAENLRAVGKHFENPELQKLSDDLQRILNVELHGSYSRKSFRSAINDLLTKHGRRPVDSD